MTQQEYCGFLCSDVIDRQKEILSEIKDFAKVNPEYAEVMLQKIADLLRENKSNIQI